MAKCWSVSRSPRRHAELALPWAEALLAEAGIARAQLDAVAVGRGPGAFTGVRLGVALAQGIALALDRPVVPVSTLAALAALAGGARVLAAIDAAWRINLGAFERESDSLSPCRTNRSAHPMRSKCPEAMAGTPWEPLRRGGRRFAAAPRRSHCRARAPAPCPAPPKWRVWRRRGWRAGKASRRAVEPPTSANQVRSRWAANARLVRQESGASSSSRSTGTVAANPEGTAVGLPVCEGRDPARRGRFRCG